MHEIQFNQQILGLKSSWKVADVKLDATAQQVNENLHDRTIMEVRIQQ